MDINLADIIYVDICCTKNIELSVRNFFYLIDDTISFRFWEILAYLANTLIFFIVGVAIMEKAFDVIEEIDWLFILVDYCGIFVIR